MARRSKKIEVSREWLEAIAIAINHAAYRIETDDNSLALGPDDTPLVALHNIARVLEKTAYPERAEGSTLREPGACIDCGGRDILLGTCRTCHARDMAVLVPGLDEGAPAAQNDASGAAGPQMFWSDGEPTGAWEDAQWERHCDYEA